MELPENAPTTQGCNLSSGNMGFILDRMSNRETNEHEFGGAKAWAWLSIGQAALWADPSPPPCGLVPQ